MPEPDPMDLAAQFAALNTATRRLNEAITDARTERQLLVEARKGLQSLINSARAELQKIVDDAVGTYLNQYLDTIGPTMREEMNAAIASSSKKFSAQLDTECDRVLAEIQRLRP
jgi:F0F1-type ATP synthase membrane subunit b/b'